MRWIVLLISLLLPNLGKMQQKEFIDYCIEIEETQSAIVTYYNAVKGQCDDTPDITADGTRITDPLKQRIVAISRPMESIGIKMGDTLDIHSKDGRFSGKWIVKDRMNKRFTKKKIDFLLPVGMKIHGEIKFTHIKKNDNDNIRFRGRRVTEYSNKDTLLKLPQYREWGVRKYYYL